jgi:hypothetical protein
LKAQHVLSGTPLIIRSSKLYLQPLVYMPIWAYKPEGTNTIQSSWWWAVCRSKHVEPSKNFGIINFITKLHLVGISTEWIFSPKMHLMDNFKITLILYFIFVLSFPLRSIQPVVSDLIVVVFYFCPFISSAVHTANCQWSDCCCVLFSSFHFLCGPYSQLSVIWLLLCFITGKSADLCSVTKAPSNPSDWKTRSVR